MVGATEKVMASIHKLVWALIRQAKFRNAAQARRWFTGDLSNAVTLLTTPFLDLEKAIPQPASTLDQAESIH